MDSERNSNGNGGEEEEELEFEVEDQEQEDNNGGKDEILKTRISAHPLYQLLLEAHLGCLKVGADISNLGREQKIILQMEAMKKQNLGKFSQSELDLFMEAYCLALGKLKEAMEKPQLKSMAYINNMHSQLGELTKTTICASAEPAATASESASSSECKFGETLQFN